MKITHFFILLSLVYSWTTSVTGKPKILGKIESLLFSKPSGTGLLQIGKNAVLGTPQVVGLELVDVLCKFSLKKIMDFGMAIQVYETFSLILQKRFFRKIYR